MKEGKLLLKRFNELSYSYMEQYPNAEDPINCMNDLGIEKLIEILENANGREIKFICLEINESTGVGVSTYEYIETNNKK